MEEEEEKEVRLEKKEENKTLDGLCWKQFEKNKGTSGRCYWQERIEAVDQDEREEKLHNPGYESEGCKRNQSTMGSFGRQVKKE